MTGAELIQKLSSHDLSVDELIENLDSNNLIDEFGEVQTVDENGNCEGGGEYSDYVFFFKDHGIYVRVTGCYTSYNGTDWENDWSEVMPKEKTITVYE